jgi:hypothetical protein
MQSLIYNRLGTFTGVRVVRRDPGDFGQLSRGKKRIYFSFLTKKGVDGLEDASKASD